MTRCCRPKDELCWCFIVKIKVSDSSKKVVSVSVLQIDFQKYD